MYKTIEISEKDTLDQLCAVILESFGFIDEHLEKMTVSIVRGKGEIEQYPDYDAMYEEEDDIEDT